MKKFFAKPSGGWRLGCWWLIVIWLGFTAFKIIAALAFLVGGGGS